MMIRSFAAFLLLIGFGRPGHGEDLTCLDFLISTPESSSEKSEIKSRTAQLSGMTFQTFIKEQGQLSSDPRTNQAIGASIDVMSYAPYSELAPMVADYLMGKKTLESSPLSRNATRASLKKFRTTRNFLVTQPPITLDTLTKIHKEMSRNEWIFGNFVSPMPKTVTLRDTEFSIQAEEGALADETGPYLKIVKQNGNVKLISPDNTHLTEEATNIIKETNPGLFEAIQRKPKVFDKALTQEIVRTLAEYSLKTFREKMALLSDVVELRNGTVVGPAPIERQETLIRISSELLRDLAALKIFPDEDLASIQLFSLYLPAIISNTVPPRSAFENRDFLTQSLEDNVDNVRNQVISVEKLILDLKKRAALGISLESSPEWLLVSREARLQLKDHHMKEYIPGKGWRLIRDISILTELEAEEFSSYIRSRLLTDTGLRDSLQTEPLKTLEKLNNEYVAFIERQRIFFAHDTEGNTLVGTKFVDAGFMEGFGKTTSSSPEIWKLKMATWYRDASVWRGLAYRHRTVDEAEIISMFTKPHAQMASNRSASHFPGSFSDLIKSAQADFEAHNGYLVTGTLHDIAKDHSEAGPMYGTSPYMSTSLRMIVGRAFAMGAMQGRDYGKQNDPDFQASLKSRILIGANATMAGVDLSRLSQPEQYDSGPGRFRYKYGRQKEIMEPGIVDPDAIMVVHSLGFVAEKDVVLVSYIRDPNRPYEIHVVQGEFIPTRENPIPPPNSGTRIIDLRNFP